MDNNTNLIRVSLTMCCNLFWFVILSYAHGDVMFRDEINVSCLSFPRYDFAFNPTLKDSFFKHFTDTGLEQFFCDAAFHFHTDVLGLMIQSEYRVVDAWVNHCASGGQPFHAHVNSFLSGTFYLDHDADAAPIEFVNPRLAHQIEPAISFTPDHSRATVFSQPTALIKPQPGDLILWESHIRHGYNDNKSPNRLSLSMNMIPRVVFSHRYGFEVSQLEEEWEN